MNIFFFLRKHNFVVEVPLKVRILFQKKPYTQNGKLRNPGGFSFTSDFERNCNLMQKQQNI